MTLPYVKKNLHFYQNVQEYGEHELATKCQLHRVNPLRGEQNLRWFKKTCAPEKVPQAYSNSISDQVMHAELMRLFEIFDADKSGHLDFDEISLMFQTAGLIIDNKILKKVFTDKTARSKFKIEDFSALLKSTNVQQRFKSLLNSIRQKYQQRNFSMLVSEGEIFLPTDLATMITYLDKKFQRNLCHAGIQMDKHSSVTEMSPRRITNETHVDFAKFMQMFNLQEAKSIESELRQKQMLSGMEARFRLDQKSAQRGLQKGLIRASAQIDRQSDKSENGSCVKVKLHTYRQMFMSERSPQN